MRIEARQLPQQTVADAPVFPHADDAAAADRDARLPHAREGGQPFVVGPRGDDLAVELRGRIEVVVVRSQPRGGQLGCLLVSQHAERAARLHPEASHHAHHRQHPVELRAFRCVPPGAAHAEARCALGLRARGRLDHLVERDQVATRHVSGIVRRLRTIRAVFRAAAGLDAEQHAALHLVGAVIRPLGLLRAKDQIRERRGVNRFDFLERPVVPEAGISRRGHRRLSLAYPPGDAAQHDDDHCEHHDRPAERTRGADCWRPHHVQREQANQDERDDARDKTCSRACRRTRGRLDRWLGGRRAAAVADEGLVGDFGSAATTLHNWSISHLVIWSSERSIGGVQLTN